jgi:hypothetical protein
MCVMLIKSWIRLHLSGNRLAALLPVLVLLHLGLAHADHVSLGELDQSDHGNTGTSHHVSVANTDSEKPAGMCPVPSATVRADLSEVDIVLQASPVTVVIQFSESSISVIETSVIPKRLDGPNRQALLERFLL